MDLVKSFVVYDTTYMAEYQSPNSLFGTRLTDVVLMETMMEVLFYLLEGLSLDVVENAADWEVNCFLPGEAVVGEVGCLLPKDGSLDVLTDGASTLSSALATRLLSLHLLLLL